MLASLRAELLVLRKWRAAWALLAVTPLLTLAAYYLVPFVQYLIDTPARYAQLGSPSQILPTILPGQFVIVAAYSFGFSGAAPFIVLGAMMAGGDWGRGTIKTALLQGPGRTRTFGGQGLAMVIACAVSVAVTFAVAGTASIMIALLETGSMSPAAGPMPAVAVVARGLGVGLLISVTYGAAGIAMGTWFRSTSLSMAVGLLWTVIAEGILYDLGLQAGGALRVIVDVLPTASIASISSTFGALGGGANTSMYFPIRPAIGFCVLVGYTAASLSFALILLRRRDVGVGRVSRRRRRPNAGGAADPNLISVLPAQPRPPLAQGSPASSEPGRKTSLAVRDPAEQTDGVLASVRAELLVLSKRPAVWAFVLLPALYTLLGSYVIQYVYYRTASSGLFQGLNPDQILPGILPGQFVMVSLNSLGAYGLGNVGGTITFVIIGALVAGSDWGEGTIKTSLLQGPGRVQTTIGQALAVMLAAAVSIVTTVLTACAASTVIAMVQTGSASPAVGPFPAPEDIAGGLVAALLVSLAYGAAGWALGTLFRSAGGAIAAVLLWSVVLQPTLDNLAAQFHGTLQTIYDILPDASTNSLARLFGTANTSLPLEFVRISPAVAFITLGAYALALFTIPQLLIRRRDVL